jgi:hypothetical protein
MTATFELVDHEGGNLLGSFASEVAALESIRQCLADPPSRRRVRDFAPYGKQGLIVRGSELADRASAAAKSSRRSA